MIQIDYKTATACLNVTLGISYAAILLDTRNETCGVDPKHMIIRNEHALRMKQQQTTASVRSEK
jgi:hypothetical protein